MEKGGDSCVVPDIVLDDRRPVRAEFVARRLALLMALPMFGLCFPGSGVLKVEEIRADAVRWKK
jgi:hypothetical protein